MSKKATMTPAAMQVVEFLTDHPGWYTVKDIDAKLKGAVARGTISKVLKGLWDKGEPSVNRSQGPRTSTGVATADLWAGVTTKTPPPGLDGHNASGTATHRHSAPGTIDAPVELETDSDIKEDASNDDAADGNSEAEADSPDVEPSTSLEEPANGPDTDVEDTESGAPDVSPVHTSPAPAAIPPNPNVIAVAGILGDHAADGITAAELAAASGVHSGLVWRILVTADIAGAAVSDKTYVLDPTARWRPGEGDIGSVNPAEAPTQVECPCCGVSKRLPAGRATSGQTGGGARDGVCADGGTPEPPGTNARLITEWALANPGVEETTGVITKAIGSRSSGAVSNALVTLSRKENPVISPVSGSNPKKWRAAEAPQPNNS